MLYFARKERKKATEWNRGDTLIWAGLAVVYALVFGAILGAAGL
jgi:hypothetical protein